MTLAEQDQLGRELTDIKKRLDKLDRTIEKLTATRAILMDAVGSPTPYSVGDQPWSVSVVTANKPGA